VKKGIGAVGSKRMGEFPICSGTSFRMVKKIFEEQRELLQKS
jgi:hypothetical protein